MSKADSRLMDQAEILAAKYRKNKTKQNKHYVSDQGLMFNEKYVVTIICI